MNRMRILSPPFVWFFGRAETTNAAFCQGYASAPWYQVLSIVVTVASALWAAWQNNDWTFFARLGTGILDGLQDGKITVEEVKKILDNENHQENK